MDKRRPPQSPDWELFHKVDETKKLAKCSLCSKILSYGVSTSELTKHLQRHGFGLQVEQDAGDGGESREMKTCSVWEYFTRDCEDDFAKCNICLERVSFEGESSLFEHLKDRHKDIQILETETDDETVRAYKGSKSKKCSDSVFFKKNKDADSLKCTLCSEALSGDDEAHMARHLAEKHKHLGKEPATEHRGSDTERNGPGNRSRGSVVWHYFKVVDRRRMQARCSLCANTFSFMTSVSNLKKHLIKMHHLNFDNARDASNPLDKYFARSPDDGSVSCSLCEQPLEDGRKASLLQHLHDHHRPEAAEAEDGADDDPPRSGRNRLRSLSWRYFSIVDRRRSVARCALCAAHLSYFGTITNLKKHLLSKHRLDPARGRLPQDSPKYCSIWEYFTKSLDDDTVKCNMCKEILLYESERSLIEHMRAKHADIEILEQETDADSDQTDVETKPTPKVLRAWRHFKKTSSANKMAECKLCKMEVSYEDADNLLDHLKQHHSRKRSTSDADGSKKFTVSASGALYELEQEDNFDDNVQDENAIFLEEYKEPRPGSKILGKKARKRKRNSGQNHSDSDTSEDNLNIYKNIKEASTRDESLHHFSKYLVSLLRELPKDVSRKLQLDFIMQINEARTSRRPATVTNTRRSSSE